MQTPTMFKNINQPSAILPKGPANPHAFIGKIVVYAVLLIVLIFAGIHIFNFTTKVASNWKELEFAYNKPAAVKVIRTQYEGKQTALDAQFTQNKESEDLTVLKKVEAALQVPSK